jgi:hypothetical protein
MPGTMDRGIQVADGYAFSRPQSMVKSVDSVYSMVVSATFVCRGYTYTDETLIEVDYHLTSSGDSIGIASTACMP